MHFLCVFSSDKILLVKLSGQKLIQVQIHQDWMLLHYSTQFIYIFYTSCITTAFV